MYRRHWIGLSVISIVSIFITFRPLLADKGTWKIGVASARITPEKPLWMAGYGARDRPAQGTLHELWVKALALEPSDGDRGVGGHERLVGISQVNVRVDLRRTEASV